MNGRRVSSAQLRFIGWINGYCGKVTPLGKHSVVVEACMRKGLIGRDPDGLVFLTDTGRATLADHGIIVRFADDRGSHA